jgi:hypothetical protein
VSKKNAPVVIVRKDKKLHKGLHLFAFLATGGMSAPVSAAKGATNAGYNARTRKLAAQVDAPAAPRQRGGRQRASDVLCPSCGYLGMHAATCKAVALDRGQSGDPGPAPAP